MRRFFAELLPHLVDGQCMILRSTVYPGTTEKIREIIARVGQGASTSPSAPSGSPQGRRWRSSSSSRRSSRAATTTARRWPPICSAGSPSRSSGCTPLEAELTKIFANVWRYIQFATANQFFMIATDYGLDFYRDLRRADPRLSADGRTCPRAGSPPAPACSRTRCSLPRRPNNSSRSAMRRCSINEGLPNFLVRHMKLRYSPAELTGRHARHGVQGRQRRPPRVALVQAPQDPRVRGRRGPLHRRLHRGPVASSARRGRSSVPTCSSSAAPHSEYRTLVLPDGKPVVDIWNIFGKGASLA